MARRLILGSLIALGLATGLWAQDDDREDNGFIIRLLEDQLSTEHRKIRLSGISGLLSSKATVERITISDPEGIWLQIEDAEIDWSRSALLSGALEIKTLKAAHVDFPRGPVPEPGIATPEAAPLRVPDLPVSVSLDEFGVESLTLGEALVGLEAELSVAGSAEIAEGDASATLTIDRLDGPGGSFALDFALSQATETLKLDLSAQEPAGGVVAGALGLTDAPPVALTVRADGPLAELDVNIDLQLDERPLVDGLITVRRAPSAAIYGLQLSGGLSRIVPPEFAAFFGGQSAVRGEVRVADSGEVTLDGLTIESGGLGLTATAALTADRFLRRLAFDARLGGPEGEALLLPVSGGRTTIQSGVLTLSYDGGEAWAGALTLRDLKAGDIWAAETDIAMSGLVQGLNTPDARRVTAEITGAATGLSSPNRDIRRALGEALTLDIATDWATGRPLMLDRAVLEGALFRAALTGTVEEARFDGTLDFRADDLRPLSGVTGRSLGGGVALNTSGMVAPLSGAFDLRLDGTAQDLALGIAALDPMLAGQTRLTGAVSRDDAGIRADRLRIRSDQVELVADGAYASDGTDIEVALDIFDLAAMTERAGGAARFAAAMTGGPGRIDVTAEATVPEGRFQGREARDLVLAFTGAGPDLARLNGQIEGRGRYGGAPFSATGLVMLSPHVNVLQGFELELLGAAFNGTVGQGGDGLLAGRFSVVASDIAPLAGLALLEADGAADLRVQLSRAVATQRVEAKGQVTGLNVAGLVLNRADVALLVEDAFGIPLADGNASVEGLVIAGTEVERAGLRATSRDGTTDFAADGALGNGTSLTARGALTRTEPGFDMALDAFRAENQDVALELANPATLEVADGRLGLSPLTLVAGDGSLALEGAVSQTLDLTARVRDLPMTLAELADPTLALEGTLSGDLRLFGPVESPQIDASLSGTGLAAPQSRALGLPAIDITFAAEGLPERVTVEGTVAADQAFSARVGGQTPLDPQASGADLVVELDRLSIGLIDSFAGNQGLRGDLSGTAAVTGALASPEVAFDLAADGVTARLLSQNGIGALNATARGSYADFVTQLASLSLSGAGLNVEGSGTIPLFEDGLDVRADGQFPLGLANIALTRSGVQLQGTATVSGVATGRLDAPQLSGRAAVSGGSLAVPAANIRLNGIEMALRGAGDRIEIDRAEARVAAGGQVGLSGGLSLAGNMPANLRMGLRDAAYSDGELITTELSGDLALDGPLLGAARVSGTIDVGRTEIAIPRRFGINEGVLLDIRHRNLPQDVRLTLDRADVAALRNGDGSGGGLGWVTDIRIEAPNQIFVRGRGLDAELGGRLALQGTTDDLVPVGNLELIRGRMGILGQRFDFDQGAITMIGNFDPRIRFVAETDVDNGTVVTITVDGRASDPQVTFTSNPELPQDEVLALLIFNQNVSELSPLQLAQLASAAATLAGKGGPGTAEKLRAATGLANLDVTSDEEGGLGVRAGAYVTEKIYLDVETGSTGSSKATINIDLHDAVRARTSVDSNGESTIGIFWERDY